MASSSPSFNSKSPTIRRILKEAQELSSQPSPDYHASPATDTDLFDWHFTIRGPPAAPYESGIYHGRIVLPSAYPHRPPSFRFLTPSGRFEVNREICLSISGHHEETWQPAWGIRTALVALRAFMSSDAKGQLGGLETSEATRERMAKESALWKCGVCGKGNASILEETSKLAKEREDADGGVKPKETEIPKELKLAYKDELGGKKNSEGKSNGVGGEDVSGAVDTAPVLGKDGTLGTRNSGIKSTSSTSGQSIPARPGQTVPAPTGTVQNRSSNTPPAPQPGHQPTATTNQQRIQHLPHPNSDVPAWVDRAIVGLVICLVIMVLKILLGL